MHPNVFPRGQVRSLTSRTGAVRSPRYGWLVAIALAGWFALPGCSRRSSEFHRLQSNLITASGCSWDRQFRLGIPACVFGLARMGLNFVELEPEAKAALETVRGARFALYQLAAGSADRGQLREAADRAMAREGWERVVGAFTGDACVLVYVPVDLKAHRDLELCVVVFDGRQLTFVSGRANPAPLTDLALGHLAREERAWRQGSRL